jgi:hypothetical protein
MQDISSNVSIVLLSQTSLKVVISSLSYNTIRITPPALLDTLSNIVGTTVETTVPLEYTIVYSNKSYIGTVNAIINAERILVDQGPPAKTNFTAIMLSYTRVTPTVVYTLTPASGSNITCKDCIKIKVKITDGLPSGIIPINISSPFPLTFKDNTSRIFYNGTNLIFVNPGLFEEYNEEICLVPTITSPTPGNIVLTTVPSSIVNQASNIYTYSVNTAPIPLTITNLVESSPGVWTYPAGNINIHFMTTQVFALDVKSDDCNPTFQVVYGGTYFSIDSTGKITVVQPSALVVGTCYDFSVVVRDIFGGQITVNLKICVLDVLNGNLLMSHYPMGMCGNEIRSLAFELKVYCPEDETKTFFISHDRIVSLTMVGSVILQAINMIFYYTINTGFNTDTTDIMPFTISLLSSDNVLYSAFLKSQVSVVSGSLLDKKIDFFVGLTFEKFKKIMKYFIESYGGTTFRIQDPEILKIDLSITAW